MISHSHLCHPPPASSADGIFTVHFSPQDLPQIAVGDLIEAWQAATQAAQMGLTSTSLAAGAGGASDSPQGVLFHGRDGEEICILFADRDAACWALAVDRSVGLDSAHGLAVCFRLLGLIDQLAHAVWLRPHFSVGGPAGPDIDPAILKTAATEPLTHDARFENAHFERSARRLLRR